MKDMQNKVIVYNENNEKIEVEIFLSFEVEELHKQYVAYTINDNNESEEVPVFISEFANNTLKNIPSSESKMVMECYEEAKKMIEEE